MAEQVDTHTFVLGGRAGEVIQSCILFLANLVWDR